MSTSSGLFRIFKLASKKVDSDPIPQLYEKNQMICKENRISYYIKNLETRDDATYINAIPPLGRDVSDSDLEWYAELAAEHAWELWNGLDLEDGFVIVIIIDGQEYGSFGIHVDWSPIFHVSKVGD